jgi:hypothetical protein
VMLNLFHKQDRIEDCFWTGDCALSMIKEHQTHEWAAKQFVAQLEV